MPKQLLPAVLTIVIGGLVGFVLVMNYASQSSDGAAPGSATSFADQLADGRFAGSDPEQMARALDSLAHVLEEEIAERRILAEQLDALREQLVDLEDNLGSRVTQAFAERNSSEAAVAATGSVREQARPETQETRLASLGFSPGQIEDLSRRRGELLMQQIELDDRARREGWNNSARYYRELGAMRSDLEPIRRDLGDDAYDRYLYAIGYPNRVTVGGIIETSPAQQAGLRAGDVIVSYGGERVFSNTQLSDLRSTGDRGAPVSVGDRPRRRPYADHHSSRPNGHPDADANHRPDREQRRLITVLT